VASLNCLLWRIGTRRSNSLLRWRAGVLLFDGHRERIGFLDSHLQSFSFGGGGGDVCRRSLVVSGGSPVFPALISRRLTPVTFFRSIPRKSPGLRSVIVFKPLVLEVGAEKSVSEWPTRRAREAARTADCSSSRRSDLEAPVSGACSPFLLRGRSRRRSLFLGRCDNSRRRFPVSAELVRCNAVTTAKVRFLPFHVILLAVAAAKFA
jgi:hypothetical protein